MAPQGGFPTELNLSGWATLVQDVAAGLQALPPRLSQDLGPQIVALLQLLEVATRVGFCHHCCNPRPCCLCLGVPQSTPPHIVESVYGADFYIWGDPLLLWSDRSEYLQGRYVWIRATSARTVCLEHAPFGGCYTPGASHNPAVPASCWGTGWLGTNASRQALVPQAPRMAPPICQPLPFPRGRPATPYQQAVQPLHKTLGLGVTFDSSTTKPAPTCSQDADARGRQATQGRDDNSRPANRSQRARERSSIRMTSKQTPRQEGGCPSGVPHNVPPASTPGSTLHQCGGGTRAPKDPLESVANYRSSGWRKDLNHIL